MPSHPHNPFGDESVDPLQADFDESIAGVPRKRPVEPPLPKIPRIKGPESAPVTISHRQHQPYTDPNLHLPQQDRGNQRTSPLKVQRRFSWARLTTWLLIAPFSGAACFYLFTLRKQMAEETMELTFKPAKAKITMSVQGDWQDLGFSLRPGDRIAITASGEYFDPANGILTAEGVAGSEGENKGSRAFDPIFPHGCLIARARGKPTEVFQIGAAGLLESDTGGRLQVRINDLDLVGNQGKLFVEARTFYKDPPNGETLRGLRDSAITPINR